MPKLLSVWEMPQIGDIRMPWDLYVVMRKPLLAGMCYPYGGISWDSLAKAGFTDVVCLCDEQVDYDPAPLRLLHAIRIEDLFSEETPMDPEKDETLIREAVKVVVDGLSRGEGIVVHCAGGIGRTGMIIGCVLREFGLTADEAVNYLDRLNMDRGIGRWSKTKWQADMVRRY